jgi:2-oxoglutarate dehydrogenase E2 component (dihydrolipoamide succinyltransferase)
MAIELKVPAIGESISEVEIGEWLKQKGEAVRKDEPVVSLESEKATVELPSPEAGTLTQILKQKGDVAKVGETIAVMEKDGKGDGGGKSAEKKSSESKPEPKGKAEGRLEAKAASASTAVAATGTVMPAAQRALDAHGLKAEQVPATGPGGRLLKEDVLRHVEQGGGKGAAEAPSKTEIFVKEPSAPTSEPGREEEVVPMTRLRRTVAERLVQAQHNAALLTTFNEIDMSAVMGLRKENGEAFMAKYGVKLGFMSFFIKASIDALKQFPAINSEVRGTNIIYRNFFDIGVAVGSGKGLVVPVIRNAERLSFAEIEMAVGDFGKRAKENKLKVDELQGGTFTISNGGVYGSLLSTPIINPPQSGVLGMHAIQERPVAREGNVVIRPMMYVALTYDHRVVDGREAVSFLKRLKEDLENPARMLVEA